MSAPTWNYEFELLDGCYCVPVIQYYFECITKKHETLTDNLPLRMQINKIENRIAFKIKPGCCHEFLTPEANYLEALKISQLKLKMVKMPSFKNY